jgi:hypothetical protein
MAARSGEKLIGLARPIVQARVRVEFVSVPAGELAAVALTLCRSAAVTSVVVCPRGVPPAATALASAVATLLEKRRGRTAVVCVVRQPALDVRCWQVARPVLVEDGDGIEARQVWELGGDVAGFVAALPAWPV